MDGDEQAFVVLTKQSFDALLRLECFAESETT